MLHICAKDKHIGIVEGSTRTIEEREMCTFHYLPHQRYPKIITIWLVKGAVSWLNSFPPKDGVLGNLIPAKIVLGKQIVD